MAKYTVVLNDSGARPFSTEMCCDFSNERTWTRLDEGHFNLNCENAFPEGKTPRITGVAVQENLNNPVYFFDGYRMNDNNFELFVGNGEGTFDNKLQNLCITIETF